MGASNSKAASETQEIPPEPESEFQEKASFSSLPAELRQKVWLLTLQPRVLYLHIHQRIEPQPYDEEGFIDGFRKTVSVSFTAQLAKLPQMPLEAFKEYTDYVAPDPKVHFDSKINRLSYKMSYNLLSDNIVATRPWSMRNSRGPVALEVCRESREVALKRYELAFAGENLALEPNDKKEWDKKGLGEKRIWVDFERDIIFVEAIWRPRKYSKCAQLNPLGLLRRYAPEDSNKIQRLAIGATWNWPYGGAVMAALRGRGVAVGGDAPSWQRRPEWFWGFDHVVELFVDDLFKDQDQLKDGLLEEELVAEKIEERMREWRKQCPEWTAEVPRVKVIRGSDWASYIE